MSRPDDRALRNLAAVCLLAGLAGLFTVVAGGSASAQQPTSIGPPSAPATSPTVDDLEALAAKIESEQGRAQLLGEIRALIALQKQKTQAAPEKPFSERVAEAVSQSWQETSRALASAGGYIPQREVLANWVRKKILDPENLSRLSRQAMPIVLVLALAWIAEFIVGRLLARPRMRLEDRAGRKRTTAFGPAVARAALRLCALAAFALVAYTAFFFLQPGAPIGSIAVQIFTVYIAGRALVILTRTVLAPAVSSLRLLPLRDGAAAALFAWIRRLIIVALAGYLAASTALLFGLPARGFSGLMDLLGFVLLVMIIICILRNRTPVAAWIRGRDDGPAAPRSFSRHVRSSLAAVWHILAAVYVVGLFVVWWQDIPGGFVFLIRGTLLTALLLLAARLANQGLRGRIVSKITAGESLRGKFPILTQRLNRYVPVVFFFARTAIAFLAAAGILEAWKLDAFSWLAKPFARQFWAFSFSMILVAVAAAVVWEAMNIATEHYLAKSERPGQRPGHGARVRTLLPLARKALTIVLSVMVVMIALSEIGVNIGPLLAGAGIIGLAVGFGAQKLVQDIITGVFILLEDAITVGDVVQVAGIGGLVEDLSIRSIRLRDLSGNVHTIPFSSVGAVTNMTRLYSYYLMDITVAYREDTDQVAAVCREIVEEMRSDPEFGPDILEPLEVLGVDQFADSAVVIKARIKTQPIRQWAVGREFNRRMKKRFDELGIEIPFPHRTLYFGAGKVGSAPPVRVVVEPK